MERMSAKDAKNEFGRLIDVARAQPVTIEKHGRPVVVVLSVEEYKRLLAEGKKDETTGTTSTEASDADDRKV